MIKKKPKRGAGKKKVLMIVYTVYPFDARVLREAETLAASESLDVTVLCLKENSTPATYAKERVIVRELNQAKYFGKSRLRYLFCHLQFLIRAFVACSWLFARGEIDIIHVHNMPNFLVLAAVIPWLFGKPVILDMHDSVPDTFEAKFKIKHRMIFRMLCLEERLSAWISDRVICVNHVQKEVTVRRGIPPEKIYVYMNVPDHKRFIAQRVMENFERQKDGKFKVVYHGTITERLGIDLAIEAATALSERIRGLEFHIWGRGDYLDFLKKRCRELGIGDMVFFHGMVPIDDLSKALAVMDLGVIPNRRSAATDLMLPVKLMEYIALGIPVVAPRLKAIEHYFSDEMVSYFEPEDIESMAEAIVRIYQDESRGKLMAENAKAFLEKYGWQKKSLEFIDYYLRA